MSSGSKDSTMIDEDELTALLRAEAQRFEVPPSGADTIRASMRSDATPTEPLPSVSWFAQTNGTSGERKVALALGAVAAVVVVALLIGSLGGRSEKADTAAEVAGGKVAQTSTTASGSSSGLTGGSSSDSRSRTSKSMVRAPATTAPSGARQGGTGGATAPGVPEKIIKTGSIELQVPRHSFSARIARLTSIANGLGGFVAETDTSEQGAAPSGTITVRVPAQRFEQLLVSIRNFGTVQSATTGSKDVTSEYTDVTGRLKTMRDERDSLSLVLTEAKNVPDILAIRDRLNGVQAEIEQLEGRRKVIDDQADLATLEVSVHEPARVAAPPRRPKPTTQSGLSRAWHDAVDGFTGGVEAILAGSGKVLLVLLCAAGCWLIGVPVWRRVRRSMV